MKKIYIFILINLLSICTIQAQCWFTQFQKDFETGSAEFKKFIGESEDGMATYQRLYDEGSTYVLKNATYLKKFEKLTPETQKLIAKFTDNKAGSTLSKFLDDSDAEFLTYINNPENLIQVKGFLAHKTGMLTSEESEKLAEMLQRIDEIPSDKARKWLEYGTNQAVFKENREAGTAFGNLMKTQLSVANSEAYKTLAKHLNELKPKINLDDYSIYSQVQLCLKGKCIDKGEFWIPDFMLVAERTDAISGQKYLETIIVDSKLSGSTGWTPNQVIAKGMTDWNIKAIGDGALIKGSKVEGFGLKNSVTKNGDFIKLYNESGILKTK